MRTRNVSKAGSKSKRRMRSRISNMVKRGTRLWEQYKEKKKVARAELRH